MLPGCRVDHAVLTTFSLSFKVKADGQGGALNSDGLWSNDEVNPLMLLLADSLVS